MCAMMGAWMDYMSGVANPPTTTTAEHPLEEVDRDLVRKGPAVLHARALQLQVGNHVEPVRGWMLFVGSGVVICG